MGGLSPVSLSPNLEQFTAPDGHHLGSFLGGL